MSTEPPPGDVGETVYDVVLEADQWRVRLGASVMGPFRSKLDAIVLAAKFARVDPPSRVVLHLPDGGVDEEWTFETGSEPLPG